MGGVGSSRTSVWREKVGERLGKGGEPVGVSWGSSRHEGRMKRSAEVGTPLGELARWNRPRRVQVEERTRLQVCTRGEGGNLTFRMAPALR